MEHFAISINPEAFDAAVHGTPQLRSLQEGGDLAILVKPQATIGGRAAAVITFTVQMPDGSIARAQAVTTLRNLRNALSVVEGWRVSGQLGPED